MPELVWGGRWAATIRAHPVHELVRAAPSSDNMALSLDGTSRQHLSDDAIPLLRKLQEFPNIAVASKMIFLAATRRLQ